MLRLFPLLLCIAGLAGCGNAHAPSPRLALDGPPLAVAMQGESASWQGHMDRGCMAGFGSMTLRGPDGSVCTGAMDSPANEKGRLYVDLTCGDGSTMTLVFRNLGPDQGMGLGRVALKTAGPEAGKGDRMTLFYHPSPEEAWRRLGEVRREIVEMYAKGNAAEDIAGPEAP